jgi:CheY-like chemotaxis protein
MAKKTILIVEDSAVILRLVAAVLRADGHRVQMASTGEQALSTLSTTR